ncbi:nuclear transport factor 2 family protein [Sphingosinicella terrae]|uniref:nuclear transport factor 2 family protein n=1 Tax=Sphingosinicella terrae TaxID=2172047 RepID=UPI0013B3FABA|nr:nuclear transport factor 2 family protein [Sphingosinicella terrae]
MASIAEFGSGNGPSGNGLEAELIGLEASRRDALVNDDMNRLGELVSEDLVHVHATGMVHGKADLLDHAGRFLQFLDVRRGPLLVRPLGADAAVMTGPMTNVVRRRGQDEEVEVKAFVTQVWARRDGRWQIVSFHAVRLSVPGPGPGPGPGPEESQ